MNDDQSSGPCCAHLRVLHAENHQTDGTYSDSWNCAECDTAFGPTRELAEARAEIARLKADQWERPGCTWRAACAAMAAELAQLRFDNAALHANLASGTKT